MSSKSFLNKISPEKTFIVLSLFFGLLLSFITPPFQSPDEPSHFFRAYQVSGFELMGEKIGNHSGGYLPKQIVEMTEELTGNIPGHKENKASVEKMDKYLIEKPNLKKTELTDFKNTVLYPPTVYLPQALGIITAKTFNLAPLWMVYIGRILNLTAFSLIVYFAIKTAPICKWPMAMLGLMPMTLAQASSLSADATCFSLSFFLIALILNCAMSKQKKTTNGQVLAISLLALLLGLCKWAYVFIPFLFLIIPNEKFSSKKNYFLAFFAVIFSSVAGILVWSIAVQNLYLPILNYLDPQGQVQFILSHPQIFTQGFLKSFTNFFTYHSFIGNLGWLDNSLPTVIVAAYFVVLAVCGLLDGDEKTTVKFGQKIIAALTLFLSIFFIDAMMYIFWNRVGSSLIEGLQGRYFIPIAPLFFILLHNSKASITKKGGKIFFAVFAILILAFTIWMIVSRYYL